MEQTTKKNNTKKIVTGVVIAVLLVAIFAGVYHFFGPKTSEGTKNYTLQVVDKDGATTDYDAATDAQYLRGALEELEESDDFTIEGDESDYGLYINTVNGLTADYNTDGAYWAVYVNDNYAENGVDTQPVNDGDAFKLVYEVYSE